MAEQNGTLGFTVGLNIDELRQKAEVSKGIFRGMSNSVAEESNRMTRTFSTVAKAAGAMFTIKAASDFARQIINVRSEIESLEVSFDTLLGNKGKASALITEIRDFASSTPMQMSDLAKGAQQLLSFNIEAERVMPILHALGDISMGDAQKFQSLTLAFAQMSSTGKLMGQDLLQMINAGFNPLSVISEQTGKSIGALKDEMGKGAISAEAVTQAFIDATSEGGKFFGMLEKQSRGIKGSLSNLQGAISDTLNEMGEKIQGPVTRGVQTLTKLVQNYETLGRVLGACVAAYGSYKAAVMAVTAAQGVLTGVTKGYTIAQQVQYAWLLMVEKAQRLLNKTMLANPYVLATTAVLALVSALVIFNRKADDGKRKQDALNNAVDAFNQKVQQRKQRTDDLLNTINEEASTDAEKNSAFMELQSMYPEYLKNMTKENLLLKSRSELTKELNKEGEGSDIEHAQQQIEQMKKDMEAIESLQKKSRQNTNDTYYSNQAAKIAAKYADEFEIGDFNRTELVRQRLEDEVEAQGKIVKDKLKDIASAEWATKPIEQRIEITGDSIVRVKNTINDLKRRIDNEPWNPVIKFNLATAEKQLADLEKRKAALDGEQASTPQTIRNKKYWEDLKNARTAELEAMSSETKDANARRQKQREIAEIDRELSKYSVAKSGTSSNVKRQQEFDKELADERCKQAKRLAEEVRQEQWDVEQARIEGMKDGLDKTLAQNELNYRKELAQVQSQSEDMVEALRDMKEAEWNAANSGKFNKGERFDRASVTEANLPESQKARLAVYEDMTVERLARRNKAAVQQNKEAIESMLKDVETYEQAMDRIRNEFNDKRAGLVNHDGTWKDGVKQGNFDEVERQESDALKAVDEQFAQRSEVYQAWCNQISQYTLSQLEAALSAAMLQLEVMQNDRDADQQQLAETRAAVAALINEIKAAHEAGESAGSAFGQRLKELEPLLGTCADSLDAVGYSISALGSKAAETAGSIVRISSSILRNGATALQGILQLTAGTINGITAATAGATAAMSTAAEGAAGAIRVVETASVILAVIGAALAIAQEIVSVVKTARQSKHERTLKDIDNQIENITSSYDALDKQSQKTFGASNEELRLHQAELKKVQIELLNTAIAEERAQKHPDNDKIREWTNQINAIRSEMDDLAESAEEAIYGEGISSAIENFAEALTGAWEKGTSGAVSAKEQVRKMMRQMVDESIKDAIQSGAAMDRIRQKLKEFYSDGIFTDEEKSELERMAANLSDQIEAQFGWATNLFNESERSGSSRGIATASQESVDYNNGVVTNIQSHTFIISENSNIIRDNVAAVLGSVNDIRDSVASIDNKLSRVQIALNDNQIHGIRIRQ